jgi:hypothetical protein
MKLIVPIIVPTLAAFIIGTLPLSAQDLRETYFPKKLPETIGAGGMEYVGKDCLKPWVAADPSEYAGKYTSMTITDGRAQLDVKVHKAKSTEGDVRWHVDGTLTTKIGVGVNHIVSFKNAELREPKLPTFDVVEDVTPALFVIFTDPELKDHKPMHAVVIAYEVFVLEAELKD